MTLVRGFLDLENSLFRERTREGLEKARAEGRVGGRKPKLSEAQKARAVRLVESGEKTRSEVAREYGVHPSTIGRIISNTLNG